MELKRSKKPKIERKIEGKDLMGRKKKIYLYAIRADTTYVVLRNTPKSPYKIDHAIGNIEQYLFSIGFKKKPGRDCLRFFNEYGLTIYWGKVNQFDKERSLKFQATGQYLIYAEAEAILRKTIFKVRSILAKNNVLTDWKITRIDPSFLVLASDIHQIVPDKKDLILMGNRMKQSSYTYEESDEISGISYQNSKVQLKVYDKFYDIESKDYPADYLEYYLPYVREAKKKNLKLYRLELKISNQSMIFDYQTKFFSNEWSEETNKEELQKLFERFFKTHSFRKVPDNQKDKKDKRNRGRWEIDPITKDIFLRGEKVVQLKNKRRKKFKHDLHAPKKIMCLDDCIKKFARDLAKINLNFTDDELGKIQKDVLVQFGMQKYNAKTSILETIERQTTFRLAFAKSKAEIRLIRKEREKLLKELAFNRIGHYEAGFSDLEKKARARLLNIENINEDELS